MSDLLGPNGEAIPVDDTRAIRAREAQERADLITHRESELGIYDLEAVRELYKHAI